MTAIQTLSSPIHTSGNISVMLGNGDGSFAAGVSYDVGDPSNGPWGVAIGDFNGDGKEDVVTANSTTASVSVLLGNGDGTFQSPINSATAAGPSFSVAVGDFNRDGRQDVAVTGSNGVNVLMGNGDGTFQSAVSYSAGSSPDGVAVGDFNGDGSPDLVVANKGSVGGDTDTVSVLMGTNTGTFSPAVGYTVGDSPTSVVVADVNGDHVPDIVTANFGSSDVSVLLGTGTGAFSPAVNYAAGQQARTVIVGDFDADGRVDLATADFGNNSASVLLGNGDGSFQSPVSFFAGTEPFAAAVGDFDGDGRPDIAVGDTFGGSVSVLLNSASANSTPTDIALSASSVPENQPSGTTVGTFSTADPDSGDTFTYSFASGTGDTDNTQFTIVGNQLQTAASFDFEAKSSYSILVQSTESGGLSIQKTFTISISNVNEPPTVTTNVAALTVNEGTSTTNSGTFTDPEGRGTVTLTASVGAVTQNNTNGNWTWTYTPPNGPASPTVIITATDAGGLTATTSFTLNVLNVAPTITASTVAASGSEGSPVNLSAAATDPGVLDTLTYTWTVTAPDFSTLATITGAQASFSPPDNGIYNVSLIVSDGDGGTASRSPVPFGLVSWWPGQGNANDTQGVNNGTLVGGVTFAAGKVGTAFNLNGTDEVSIPSSPSLNFNNAVTLEAWIKPSTLAFNNSYGAIIAKSSDTRRDYGLFVKSTGALHLSYFNAAGTNVILETAPNLVPVNQFSHVAGVINTLSGVMQIYLNGNVVASRATSGPMVPNSVPLTIGLSDPGSNYGFKGLIDEPSVYNRPLSFVDIQSIVSDGSAGKISPVAVANVAPTPALSGFTTGLVTQVLTYTATATDPSSLDQAAGFAYVINWGDNGGATQSVPATAGNGSGISLSHTYFTAGTFTVTLSATDKDGGKRSISSKVTVLAVTSASLQTVINQQGSFTFQANTDAQVQSVTTALSGLSAQTTPTTLTLNLASGSYKDTTAHPPAGATLVINGNGGTTTIVGHSPALVVSGGNVILSNVTLVTATDAPTLQVSGGNLTLRNVDIEESTTSNQAALWITGGTVDLGTAASPGGNVFDAHGPGELIHNAGSAAVSAIGNTFEANGIAITSPYGIKDEIFDALNLHGGGLVTYVANSVYVTPASGSIQRGVDAVAAGGTVNVAAGWYNNYDAGSKLLTISFQDGPTLSQQPNSQNPSLRDVVVTGTDRNDQILFSPGGGLQVQVNGLPTARFAPTGRIVAYGLGGNDQIQVSGGIGLPALLFGGTGNDLLQDGGGDSVLVGGDGNDLLQSFRGSDLLIGGSGADLLQGSTGGDLLIAGTTAFDANDVALAAIMAEWTSGRSYDTRIANLSGSGSGPRANGNFFLKTSGPDATVFDDNDFDLLIGGLGMDWFFADLSQDIVIGRPAERVNPL